jgi:hypothetical protein
VSQLLGSNDEFAVRWNLPRLYALGLLEDGEIICELEGASYRAAPGLLVVTDLRVIFLRRHVFRGKTDVVSIALDEVRSTETLGWAHRYGTLELERGLGSCTREPGDALQRRRLGRFRSSIPDGEIVRSVLDDVVLGARGGKLVVTDRRVAFLSGGLITRRRVVVSLPLAQITRADVRTAAGKGVVRVVTKTPIRSQYFVDWLTVPRSWSNS